MKKKIQIVTFSLIMLLNVVSCKEKISDADLTAEASKFVAFYPGTNVIVIDGKAELKGEFKDKVSKKVVFEAIKKIEGIKEVTDLSTIVPAEVVKKEFEFASTDVPKIVIKVKEALKDFQTVKVEVISNVLILTGSATPDQARKIKKALDALKIAKYENKLVVK